MLYLTEKKMYMANIFIPAVPPDGFYHIAFPLTQANREHVSKNSQQS